MEGRNDQDPLLSRLRLDKVADVRFKARARQEMPTNRRPTDFRRRDPTRRAAAILVVIAVVLAMVLIDRYL
jgi:hypothetical protein